MSLVEELLAPKSNLTDFYDITLKILQYIPNVINEKIEYQNYVLCSSNIAGTKKQIRPFNIEMFVSEKDEFVDYYKKLEQITDLLIQGKRKFNENDYFVIDKTIYTMQQAIGIGMDLLVSSNSARKHVGNRFEELMQVTLSSLSISLKKIIISIPYLTKEGEKFYRCETDIVISPYSHVKSNATNIDENEIVISLKTTTKDRMPKIFIDKILLENFLNHPVKVVGISLNDIQRKGEDKISYTFVSNLFMVYTRFLTNLEGYYYLDMPVRAFETPFNNHIFRFSKFILDDLWTLLRT